MRTTILAGMALVAVGCASQPAPTDQLASSLAAVRGAEEAGAKQVPEAALHLQLAEEQLARAKKEDDGERAEALAVRAGQDAELARLLARDAAAKQRLAQFSEGVQGSGGEQLTAPAQHASDPHTTQ